MKSYVGIERTGTEFRTNNCSHRILTFFQILFTHSLRQLRELAQPADNVVGVNETGNFIFLLER